VDVDSGEDLGGGVGARGGKVGDLLAALHRIVRTPKAGPMGAEIGASPVG
jgi:hypothetical protein